MAVSSQQRRFWVRVGALGVFAALLMTAASWLSGHLFSKIDVKAEDYKLPSGTLQFDRIKPPSIREVIDRQDRVIGYLGRDRIRFYRPLSEIDSKLAEFVVLSEDAKFWHHDGFDVDEIKNSVTKNLSSGRYKRGGSTITQQLAKNMFLDKKKSITRKIYEIPWAMRLEKDLSKKQILELYLNVIEWGPGLNGAEAAARHFFDKPAADLTVGQALYLALIIPNPVRFDAYGRPAVRDFIEKKRRDFVHRLVAEKKISADDQADYLADSMDLAPQEGRRFPFLHDGNYRGNRAAGTNQASRLMLLLSDLTKLPASTMRRPSPLRVSLQLEAQNALELLEEVTAPGSSSKVWTLKDDDGRVVAVRRARSGRTLVPDPAKMDGAGFSLDNYTLGTVDTWDPSTVIEAQ